MAHRSSFRARLRRGPRTDGRGRRWRPGTAPASAALVLVGLVAVPVQAQAQAPAQAGTSQAVPSPAVPSPAVPSPVATSRAIAATCSTGAPGPCQQAVVAAIDQARRVEGVRPLDLPGGFAEMGPARQLLVLANAERVDRGLPALTGLSRDLDDLAMAGAVSDTDPHGPPGSDWGSNWAGGEASALMADYGWMYDDGPGSPNLDCPTASSPGCWAHRKNILGSYGAHPWMGAAEASVGGVPSMTELFASRRAPRLRTGNASGRPR